MKPSQMKLKILLPTGIFIEKSNVIRVIAESQDGLFGLLPHRFDCLASIVPGILTYECLEEAEQFVAVDKGVLTKIGMDVVISVRHAIEGQELGQLHRSVKEKFLSIDKEEREARKAIAKMESSFIQQLAEMKDE